MPHQLPAVVLTRSAIDNRALASRLEALGYAVIQVPTVAMAYMAPAQDATEVNALLASTPAITFTSRHGVQGWCEHADVGSLGAALARGALVAAVGRATAVALEERGIAPSLVAEPATGAALAAQLLDRLPPGSAAAIMAVQGRHARPELVDALTAGGERVQAVVVYENRVPAPPHPDVLAASAEADAVYVAAPSAAHRLLAWVPGMRDRAFVAIGPTTAASLAERHGIVAAAVAENPGIDAVEAAIVGLIPVGSQP